MCQSILFWAHCFVILCSWSCVCSKCWEICQSFCSELTTSWYFVHSVVIVNDVWKWWYLRGLFAEFMDSPYYSKLELCRGAVIISFSEHLPWQTVHFLQCSTHFSMLQIVDHFKIFCLGAPFSWLEKPRNCTGRDLNWILCLAWKKWISETPLEHLPYSPDLAPCDFLAFPIKDFWWMGNEYAVFFTIFVAELCSECQMKCDICMFS
jgi:hypothetical protein